MNEMISEVLRIMLSLKEEETREILVFLANWSIPKILSPMKNWLKITLMVTVMLSSFASTTHTWVTRWNLPWTPRPSWWWRVLNMCNLSSGVVCKLEFNTKEIIISEEYTIQWSIIIYLHKKLALCQCQVNHAGRQQDEVCDVYYQLVCDCKHILLLEEYRGQVLVGPAGETLCPDFSASRA